MAIGQMGHVSFLLLAATPPSPETKPTGENACQLAFVVAENADGTVNAAGWNATGMTRQWVNVPLASEPVAREDDPAGHVFHTECPFGR